MKKRETGRVSLDRDVYVFLSDLSVETGCEMDLLLYVVVKDYVDQNGGIS